MQTIQRFTKGEAITTAVAIYRGEQVDPLHIEYLINFLLPVLPNPPKNVWDFVSRAAAKKDVVRPYLDVIHVIDGTAYATDGHRLHYANVVGFDDGIYGTNKKKVDDDSLVRPVEFFRKVIPDVKNWQPVKYEIGLIGTGSGTKRAAFMNGLAEDQAINLAYLLDAITFDKTEKYTTNSDYGRQIVVKNKFGAAVIMGMRV